MRFSILNSDAERRDGIKALLRQIERKARFIEGEDWQQIQRTLKRYPPDLLVIDWEAWMTIADVRDLLSRHPGLRIAVLTDEISPASVREFLDEGVLGVVPRETDPSVIIKAFQLTVIGGHYVPPNALSLDPPLPPDSTSRVFGRNPSLRVPGKVFAGLSDRQQQIMRCVHMGSTNKIIARTLGIAEGTVKVHLNTIFQLLGAPNRAAAVALYNGWLNNHLRVLRTYNESTIRPIMGLPGDVPPRREIYPRIVYQPPIGKEASASPMAAEPGPDQEPDQKPECPDPTALPDKPPSEPESGPDEGP